MAARAAASLSNRASGTSVYDGTPTAPWAASSRTSASSAARREASSRIITTAATLAPSTWSGCASGACHEETNAFEAQAVIIVTAMARAAATTAAPALLPTFRLHILEPLLCSRRVV
jgi:hypothetical protein